MLCKLQCQVDIVKIGSEMISKGVLEWFTGALFQIVGEKDDLFNSQLVWNFVLSIMCHGLLYQLQHAPERLIQNI